MILLTAFKGSINSSRILLDKVDENNIKKTVNKQL